MKKIVLTGGGTAGHVTPNIALIPELKKAGYEIYYIGSYEGIEKKLIEKMGITHRALLHRMTLRSLPMQTIRFRIRWNLDFLP